ncbi:hypothetical protein B0H13DRAFT_1864243 [Mycena leptocephala]|nr:hypothetical protein B0H13DRAFT_1864243 [Mycena leptocephala]
MPRTPKLDTATAHGQELATLFWKDRLLVRNQKTVIVLGATNTGKSTFMRQVRLFSAGYNAQDRLDSASRYATACLKGYEDSAILDEIHDNPKIQATVSTLLRQSNTHQGYSRLVSISKCRHPTVQINSLPAITEIHFEVALGNERRTATTLARVRTIGNGRTSRGRLTLNSILLRLNKFIELHAGRNAAVRTALQRPHHVLQRTRESAGLPPPSVVLLTSIVLRLNNCANLTRILPMNKLDLFIEKLACMPFTVCFPDYSGPNEPVPAAVYCIQRFSFLASGPGRRDIRGWCTNALDVEQMHVE